MTHVRTIFLFATVSACTPSQEAVRVQLPVTIDASTITNSTNEEGWIVTMDTARIAVTDLQFTIQGESHGVTAWLGDWLIPRAWAHPGHYAGGNVTGELTGAFIFDWFGHDGMMLGSADMLVGDYNGINFTFRVADDGDGLAADDLLLGHTAYFSGVARKNGEEVMFTAVLDINAGTQMVGAPFELALADDTEATIAFQLEPTDPVEMKSMFDGLDFAALDDDADGVVTIEPGSEAANVFRRTLQSHIHYQAEAQ